MKIKKGDDVIRLIVRHGDEAIAKFASFKTETQKNGIRLEHGYLCTINGEPHTVMDRGCFVWHSTGETSLLTITMIAPFDPVVAYKIHTLLPFSPGIKIYYPGTGGFNYVIKSFKADVNGWVATTELLTIHSIVKD